MSATQLEETPSADTAKRFKHPFTECREWVYYDDDDDDPTEKDTPRTLIELRMCALSAAIREKPEWWVKCRDKIIQAKWREEIKEQQKDLHRSLQLTDNMIDYIMGELEAYAALRHPETGVEPGPYERIWKSDNLISGSLKDALLSAVAPLESVPEPEQDWHPGSDGKVLDLVHPSLYPVVYGHSVDRTSGEPIRPRPSDVASIFKSERFQWLPSDFHVLDDDTVRLVSPYINNIHPEDHRALTDVIPRVLEKAVPMFEWVLSDLARERQLPTRLDLKGKKFPGCVWPNEQEPYLENEEWDKLRAEASRREREDEKRYEKEKNKVLDILYDAWEATTPSPNEKWVDPPYPEFERTEHFALLRDRCLEEKQTPVFPDSMPEYDGGLDAMRKTETLRGKTIQVIVKLANIMLTPGKPAYAGGTWHVEGMDNEAIVATFIYYYDADNVTESTLSFRNAVNEPRYHEQSDEYCMKHLYNIGQFESCAQNVGYIITKQERCIAFPNIYQHLVSPFRLAHPTKPGHRKILVFFLVDPNITIPSATTVGPQQSAWVRCAVESTEYWQTRLPTELRDMVWERYDGMSDEQAKAFREELMKERTLIVQTVEEQRFGQGFNLCEH